MFNLDLYRRHVDDIRQYASDNGISASETNKIFEQCFLTLDRKFAKKVTKKPYRVFKYIISVFFALLMCTFILYNNRSTNKLILRNIQNFIYPGLKVLRKIAVPIIQQYPSLTEWYDEWCLVENPYFYISEMDCSPCSSVRSIPDLTGRNIIDSLNIGMPYTREDGESKAELKDLSKMYEENVKIFHDDANRIISNNASYSTIRDVFEKRLDENPSSHLDTRILWRVTRIKPGRLIRKLFPRPSSVPKTWSQSTERYVFIDEALTPTYALPNPECSNIVLRCTSGSRMINMIPSSECLQNCKSFAVLLSAGQTLWYNWWYWRPLSVPAVNSTDISISYLISFC